MHAPELYAKKLRLFIAYLLLDSIMENFYITIEIEEDKVEVINLSSKHFRLCWNR
jgi:hypothetical protein